MAFSLPAHMRVNWSTSARHVEVTSWFELSRVVVVLYSVHVAKQMRGGCYQWHQSDMRLDEAGLMQTSNVGLLYALTLLDKYV